MLPSTEVFKTPTNRRELYKAVSQLRASTKLDRDVRALFAKTGRGFDRLSFDLATKERRLKSCEKYIDDNRARTKKKQPVDPNKTFVTIEDIKTASDCTLATTTMLVSTTTVAAPPQPAPAPISNALERAAAQLSAVARNITHQS